jgi:hypothetical protein
VLVEWLRDEYAEQEVKGSSAGGREARVFRERSHEKLKKPCGCLVSPLLVIEFFFYFSLNFMAYFLETTSLPVQHQCRFIRTGSDVNPPSLPVWL